ncbi:Glycyl-tRNA synthetase [Nostocoides japonicum T1-X7]|uniref:Glycyl-tRNA synthetase n=1 Tax=Nostocoides japonicum T1-X7 TaxID=1194083 RepID=A0A077LU40_9MICO|nr:hypothetical protein [Tetrasphaera japonica]CCH76976.1 Glycyl-tRNA synthetase [Tetrasphaera japonica T1-X7]
MPDEDRLLTAVDTLYAVTPDEFVRTRTSLAAAAKSAGDAVAAKEIATLRRPSLAAWALNQVAREAAATLDMLLDVGGRLREAQSRLDAAAIQDLRAERDAAVDAYVTAAVDCASRHGRSLSAAARQEVRDTAIAALADETAATAASSGRLLTSLSYSGFGEVDLSDALARTGPPLLRVAPPADEDAAGGAMRSNAGSAGTDEGSGSQARAAGKAAGAHAARKAAVDTRAARKEAAEAERRARAERVASAGQALEAAERDVEETERLLVEARRAYRRAVRARDVARDALHAARET